MDIEKIIDKIQKLLALEKGTTHQAEAEAAAAKVQELLLKYNLEMEDVETHTPEEEVIVEQEYFETSERKNESSWIVKLYTAVSRYNFCKLITFSGLYAHEHPYGTQVTLVGRKGNREAVRYMVEWLIPRIREAAKEAWSQYRGPEKRGKFTRGFLIGCVEGIERKLYEEWQRTRTSDQQTQALVISRDAEMKKFLALHYPDLRAGRRTALSSWDGRSAGYEKGQTMTPRRGVGGDNKFKGYLKGG